MAYRDVEKRRAHDRDYKRKRLQDPERRDKERARCRAKYARRKGSVPKPRAEKPTIDSPEADSRLMQRRALRIEAERLHAELRWGARRITAHLGVPLRTASNWIAGSPIRSRYGNFKPQVWAKLEPSRELAYVLGTVLGDGSVSNYRGNMKIKLAATDKDFVEEYERNLSVITGRHYSVRQSIRPNPNAKDQWRVDAQSKLLGDYLKQPLAAFQPLLTAYPCPFLRAFFDAEGSCQERKWDGRTYWSLSAVNTNKELLDLADDLLRGLGIIGNRYINHRKSNPWLKHLYMWVCQRREYLRLFRSLVGFSIQRKAEVLERVPASEQGRGRLPSTR